MGTEYDNTTNTAVARAFVDLDLLANNGFEQGEAHETIEGFICALTAINEKKDIPIAKQVLGNPGSNPDIARACRQSVSAMVHAGDIYQFGAKAGRIK